MSTSHPAPYKLSAQAQAHEADIRSVSALHVASADVSLLLTASRDRTARLWTSSSSSSAEENQKRLEPLATLTGHEGFVNACAFLHDEPTHTGAHAQSRALVRSAQTQVYALTAGQDRTINAYSISHSNSDSQAAKLEASTTPDYTLLGHAENVCALDTGPSGAYIVSGSWDKTAKVWKGWQCVATLKGHLHAVWAVLAVDEDRVLTASADKVIRLWSISQPSAPLALYSGHTDAIRSLALLPPSPQTGGKLAFASCGNDATVCIYSLDDPSDEKANQPIAVLSGHTSFAYSLTTIFDDSSSSGEAQLQLASSGEDRSIRIWSQGSSSSTSAPLAELMQTITLPAVSVWSVASLPNGDLASGSNDGVLRLFTRSAARAAPAEEARAFEAAVASQELNKAQIGDVKLDSLPSAEVLQTVRGKKEGEVKMVRNVATGQGEAHQWTLGAWQKIGDVLGGVAQGQKQLYQGKEYDFVFDVDVAENAPPLKLPYNRDENPYFAAQRFIDKNELPQAFLEQIVKFIDQNTEGEAGSGSGAGASTYVDPYTGASRYTGSGGGGGGSSTARAPTQAAAPAAPSGTFNNPDPFTSSRPPPSSSAASQQAGAGVLPQRTPLTFKQFNPAPVKAKVAQLASQQGGGGDDDAAAAAAQLAATIDAVAAGQSSVDLAPLEKALQAWPAAARFPLLDTYRVAAAGSAVASSPQAIASRALEAASWSSAWPSDAAAVKERDTNSMLALRTLANLFARGSDDVDVASAIGPTLEQLGASSHFARLGKNGRVALATLALNVAVLALHQQAAQAASADVPSLLLRLLIEILSSEEGDSEVIYRALVAFGTLSKSPSAGAMPVESVGLAKDLAASWGQRLSAEQRIVALIKELP